jgi:hypothetical protein
MADDRLERAKEALDEAQEHAAATLASTEEARQEVDAMTSNEPEGMTNPAREPDGSDQHGTPNGDGAGVDVGGGGGAGGGGTTDD